VLLNPKEMRLFSLRAGDSIRERVGGTITSLIVIGVSWMDVFVILGVLEIDSLLVSEPHEAHKKAIRIAARTCLIIYCDVIIAK
tara:strand:+ start:330 stop:581 length:252 start_codon:yes stop_codon:yes gene_type:complete